MGPTTLAEEEEEEEKHVQKEEDPTLRNTLLKYAIDSSHQDEQQQESMLWQPILGVVAAVITMIILVGLTILVCRQRKKKDAIKPPVPIKGTTDVWIPPTQTYAKFANLGGTISTNATAGNDSSDDDYARSRIQVSMDFPPISLTSGSLVQSPVQPVNLSTIERKLSTHRRQRHSSKSSGSQLETNSSSKASDDEDNDDVSNITGKIWFKAIYSPSDEILTVEVIKAKYLRGRSIFYSPRDPFVRVYLLPDEINFFQTKVKYRTFAPRFKETFTFNLSLENASSRSLKFVIHDFDKKSVRHFLGQVAVPLANIDIMSGETFCHELDDSPQQLQRSVYIGEMLLSLFCNPYMDKLKVTVIRLRNLPTKGISKQSDVFIRADFYHGCHLAKTKNSLLHPLDINVEFQETFAFRVSGKYLDSCSIALTVVWRVKNGASAAATNGSYKEETEIGKVVVGPFRFARGHGLDHWQEMLNNTKTQVEKWHSLCESS